jgi:low affinity Fe/Cu permease
MLSVRFHFYAPETMERILTFNTAVDTIIVWASKIQINPFFITWNSNETWQMFLNEIRRKLYIN